MVAVRRFVLVAGLLGLAVPIGFSRPAHAVADDLFFSEYIEGSSNNKALEIFNGTGAAVNLSTGGYNVQMFFNGSASAGLTINLTGTVAAGDVYVVAQSSAAAAILAEADQTNGAGWFNGDDAVALRKGSAVIDVIGQIGFDPGTEWGTTTADNTLRRKSTICAGDANGGDVFDPSIEWDPFAIDTFDGLGSHPDPCGGGDAAPDVTTTDPINGAVGVTVNANVTVTFSEPVTRLGDGVRPDLRDERCPCGRHQWGTDDLHARSDGRLRSRGVVHPHGPRPIRCRIRTRTTHPDTMTA